MSDFYKNHKKLEVPICFYTDDDGVKHYDLEEMGMLFAEQLQDLTEENVSVDVFIESEVFDEG